MTEMLIVYGIVCGPLILVGLYAIYREEKEKRKEQMEAKNT